MSNDKWLNRIRIMVDVDPSLKARLDVEAERRSTSYLRWRRSDVIRAALEAFLLPSSATDGMQSSTDTVTSASDALPAPVGVGNSEPELAVR